MNNQRHDRRRVARAIKLALAQIAEKDPELARLLKETIETGRYFSYTAGCRSRFLAAAATSDDEKTRPSSRKSPIRR